MFDFGALFSAEGLVSLVSLTVMEIVLGIDNVLLVAILSQRVAPARRKRVRELLRTEVYRPNRAADCFHCRFKPLCPLYPEGRPVLPVEVAS